MAARRKGRGLRGLRRGQIIFLAVLLLLTAATGALAGVYASKAGDMLSQQAAERFRGPSETRFVQVSAFFPVDKGTGREAIYNFRNSIDAPLSEIGVEAPQGGSLWTDAYCATGQIAVEGPKGSATAQTVAVGGDWFAFHPLTLRSGTYIYEDDLMHDRVVLDETLAWQLFGGVDLAGQEVRIGGQKFIVAGVVSREDDSASRRAYPGGAGMFMHYDVFSALTGGGSGGGSGEEVPSATPEAEISCYELVCAEPLTGYTLSIVKEAFADAVAVQNTGRFSVSSELKVLGGFGERSMLQTAIVYPYWENAARLTEDILAALLVAIIAFGLFPALCLAWFVIYNLRRGWLRLRDDWFPGFKDRTEDKITAHGRRRLEEKQRRRERRGAHEAPRGRARRGREK